MQDNPLSSVFNNWTVKWCDLSLGVSHCQWLFIFINLLQLLQALRSKRSGCDAVIDGRAWVELLISSFNDGYIGIYQDVLNVNFFPFLFQCYWVEQTETLVSASVTASSWAMQRCNGNVPNLFEILPLGAKNRTNLHIHEYKDKNGGGDKLVYIKGLDLVLPLEFLLFSFANPQLVQKVLILPEITIDFLLLTGLSKILVDNVKDALTLMQDGINNLQLAWKKLNQQSFLSFGVYHQDWWFRWFNRLKGQSLHWISSSEDNCQWSYIFLSGKGYIFSVHDIHVCRSSLYFVPDFISHSIFVLVSNYINFYTFYKEILGEEQCKIIPVTLFQCVLPLPTDWPPTHYKVLLNSKQHCRKGLFECSRIQSKSLQHNFQMRCTTGTIMCPAFWGHTMQHRTETWDWLYKTYGTPTMPPSKQQPPSLPNVAFVTAAEKHTTWNLRTPSQTPSFFKVVSPINVDKDSRGGDLRQPPPLQHQSSLANSTDDEAASTCVITGANSSSVFSLTVLGHTVSTTIAVSSTTAADQEYEVA